MLPLAARPRRRCVLVHEPQRSISRVQRLFQSSRFWLTVSQSITIRSAAPLLRFLLLAALGHRGIRLGARFGHGTDPAAGRRGVRATLGFVGAALLVVAHPVAADRVKRFATDVAHHHGLADQVEGAVGAVVFLQEAQKETQKETEHDLKKLSAQDLNKSYQSLQQQVQQTTNSQQKAQFKNQLHEIHEEISKRTQKQLQAFAKKNPEIKQPDSEPDKTAPADPLTDFAVLPVRDA